MMKTNNLKSPVDSQTTLSIENRNNKIDYYIIGTLSIENRNNNLFY